MSAARKEYDKSFEYKLDEIIERLNRIQELIVIDRLERIEDAEKFEGDLSDTSLKFLTAQEFGGDKDTEAIPGSRLISLLSSDKLFEQFIDNLGLNFFSGREFTPYWNRERNGVKNEVPPTAIWPNIVPTLVILERLREDLGSPIFLLSTYRSEDYNRAVGGVRNSQHVQFRAIDFTSTRETPIEWGNRLKSYRGKTFKNPLTGDDFIFRGGIGIYQSNNFVHVDTRGYDANWTG